MKTTALIMTALTAAALIGGCQSADPASRSNQTRYRDAGRTQIDIRGSSNTVSVTNTVGDGLLATADGGGDTQSNTPTHTVTTTPEVAVGVGGGSAGTGGAVPSSGIVGEALNKLMSLVGGSSAERLTAAEAAAIRECVDGNCEIPPATP
jgi:hypothetical protein